MIYYSQFSRFVPEKYQTFLQVDVEIFFLVNIYYVFLGLVGLSICATPLFHREPVVLFSLCLLCYLALFQQSNDSDSHKMGCRIHDEPISHLKFHQRLFRMPHDVHIVFYSLPLFHHSHLEKYNRANSSNHLGFLFSELSPKSVLCHLQYTCVACQTPVLMCQAPAIRSRAGHLI